MDVFSAHIDVACFDRVMRNTGELARPTLDEAVAERVVRNLVEADSPVLYVGGGVILAGATDELRQFAELLSLPVAHSLMGKGAVPDDHPLVLGMTGFWGTKFINDSCRNADWVLALGTRFAEADSSSWDDDYTFSFPPAKLMQVDIDPAELGRNYPLEIGAVADLTEALTVLLRVARRLSPNVDRREVIDSIRAERTKSKAANAEAQASDDWPMRPERILAEVRDALPRDAIITTDVGWNKNGVGQQFDVLTPGSILTPGGYATMGFGAPAALGAKIARPERTVISLVGDGGFGQNPALLSTARERNIAVVWVVMNNNAFGTIAGLELAHFDTTYGTVFEDAAGEPAVTDFAAIARAYGIDGIRVDSAADFKPALEKALSLGRPVVIDVLMRNVPTPTAGHWNIMDIYTPAQRVHHVATETR
jgi:acetolactate synthase-1/2/3 large subunit